ncbi:MAG: hypothetical protein QF645_00990 [Planctomycetota bacterium]|nr:hypothetical protein [Planctomycetota bacterium]
MAENGNRVDRLVEKTPWWVVSSFFHIVILMVAALLFGVGVMVQEDIPVVVRPAMIPIVIPEMEELPDLEYAEKLLDIPKKNDSPLFRKVEERDQSQSDDDEFKKTNKESTDFTSDKPFQDRFLTDVIGRSMASAGAVFSPDSGRKWSLVDSGGGSKETESAVHAALRWLARHQNQDGSWKAVSYTEECKKSKRNALGDICNNEKGVPTYDSGVTGLAILAFLGAGYSHQSQDVYDGICFGEVVKKGLRWIVARQRTDGQIGESIRGRRTYNHLVCSLALTEGYSRTGASLLESPARQAVDFTLRMQNRGRPSQIGEYRFGWRYGIQPRDNDASVTGFAVMVLKSAELSGLAFPDSAYEGASAFFDSVTDPHYYDVGYKTPHGNACRHKSMVGVASMYRLFVKRDRKSPKVEGGARILLANLPTWETGQVDFYYWYYGSLALFQYGGEAWQKWNRAMVKALLPHQWRNKDFCRNGSWDPSGCWGKYGGRVYATAINALTLEVYYRYANVFTGQQGSLVRR